MNFLKNKWVVAGVSLAWFAFVAWFYFQNHLYYFINTHFIGWMAVAIGVLAAAVFGAWQLLRHFKKDELRVNIIGIALAITTAVWLLGMTLFLQLNPAVMTGPYQFVFYEQGSVALIDENARLNEGVESIIKKGSVMLKWNDAKQGLPVELWENFKTLSPGMFGVNLAVSLLGMLGLWFFFFSLFHNVGATLFRHKKITAESFFESVALGIVVTSTGLFALGMFGGLTVPWVVGWVGALALIGLPSLTMWARAVWKMHAVPFNKLGWPEAGLALAFVVFFGLNWIASNMAYPIGFDSLSAYQNTPRLLAQYGELFVTGKGAYPLELVLSLALFLFDSERLALGMTLGMGMVALAAVAWTFRRFFNTRMSLFLVVLFMSLPMTNFMMSVDHKLDLALLLFYLLAFWEGVKYLKSEGKAAKRAAWKTALWLGFAFSIKLTALLAALTWAVVFLYKKVGKGAAFGALLIGVAVLIKVGYIFVLDSYTSETQTWLAFGLAGAGALAVLKDVKKWRTAWPVGATLLLMAAFFLPWAENNVRGDAEFNVNNIVYGKGELITISNEEFGVPQTQCAGRFEYNEIEKYTNSTKGVTNSLLFIPKVLWETTVTNGLKHNRITDIGVFFLGFVVLAALSWGRLKKEEGISGRIALLALYGGLWVITGQGVIWYGLPLLIGALVVYGTVWREHRWAFVVLVAWLILAGFLRYGDAINQNYPLLYAGGLIDKSISMEQNLAGSREIAEILNQPENLEKNVYVVGRFIPYFIERNDRRAYSDPVLLTMGCALRDEDPAVTLDRLKQKGFGFLYLSEEGLQFEVDPNGPLHGEFEWLRSFANNHLEEVFFRHGITLYRIP